MFTYLVHACKIEWDKTLEMLRLSGYVLTSAPKVMGSNRAIAFSLLNKRWDESSRMLAHGYRKRDERLDWG